MGVLWTLIIGFFSGSVAWLLTEFFAKPFRRGIDLVAEVSTELVMSANVPARARERGRSSDEVVPAGLTDDAEARLAGAERDFRKLAARLKAFAKTEPYATWALKALGRDIESAGTALISLSNSIGVYGQQRHDATRRVESSLGLSDRVAE